MSQKGVGANDFPRLQKQVLQLPTSDRAALAQALLQSLRQDSYPVSEHPLAKFAGILSNAEATELQQIITAEFELFPPAAPRKARSRASDRGASKARSGVNTARIRQID